MNYKIKEKKTCNAPSQLNAVEEATEPTANVNDTIEAHVAEIMEIESNETQKSDSQKAKSTLPSPFAVFKQEKGTNKYTCTICEKR